MPCFSGLLRRAADENVPERLRRGELGSPKPSACKPRLYRTKASGLPSPLKPAENR